jgi:hypothetical protein
MNEILRQAMRDGRLEGVFRKWKMWNDDQPLCMRASSAKARRH